MTGVQSCALPICKELEDAIDEYDGEKVEGASPPAKGDPSAIERQMLRNMLHFSEHTVDDVAVPRADIIAIEEKASFADLVALIAEHGHSRVPVYRDTLDTIIGMIHIRDAFAILAGKAPPPDTLEPLIRQPLYVPESMGALDLLAEMRAKRTHLAIVLDEYSGTEGLATFEDLVEEIVGEVEDEHDDEPEAMLVPLEGGMWEADARTELEDVAEEIGVHPSTVSRAVAGKYAHTPQGVFELRYFFSEAVQGPSGMATPLLVLKKKVKKMIDEEDHSHPLTDEQITDRLQAEGIQVTRRTVAKYREDMRIPSTHQRRVRE